MTAARLERAEHLRHCQVTLGTIFRELNPSLVAICERATLAALVCREMAQATKEAFSRFEETAQAAMEVVEGLVTVNQSPSEPSVLDTVQADQREFGRQHCLSSPFIKAKMATSAFLIRPSKKSNAASSSISLLHNLQSSASPSTQPLGSKRKQSNVKNNVDKGFSIATAAATTSADEPSRVPKRRCSHSPPLGPVATPHPPFRSPVAS